MVEKSGPWTRQRDGKNLVWFGEIERKLAKLSMPTRKKNVANYFQLSSQELHLEPIKLGKYFMSNSLTTLLLSHWHQPDFVQYFYTTVQRGVWYTVSTDI